MQENNRNQNDVPLEELRARYFGRGAKRPPVSYQYTPSSDSKFYGNEMADEATIENPFIGFTKGRTKNRILCDIALLLAVLCVTCMTVFYFAVPTVEIGGEVHYGETQTIFEFIYLDENSIINQINPALEEIKQLENISENAEDVLPVISSVMKIIRLLFLLIPSILVLVKTLLNVLFAVKHFIKKESARLGDIATKNIAQNLIIYTSFVFFGSISGGVGAESYYVGYTVDYGMTWGMFIAIGIVLAVSIIMFLNARKDADERAKNKWFASISAGIAYACIGAVLSSMRIYSIFSYVFSSSLTTAIQSLVNGFDIKALVFPLLNFFLLFSCLSINTTITNGFKKEFRYLMSYGENIDHNFKEKIIRASYGSKKLAYLIVLAILSLLAVITLNNPAYGFGWSVDIYRHFVFIFIFASIAKTCVWVFKSKKA